MSGMRHQQATGSHIPAALSPSSWARASVPLYPYGGDFSASGRFLTAPLVSSGVNYSQGRYSEPLSLRGQSVLVRALLLLNIFLWLVRDASLQSFILYSIFINVVVYFLVVRGEPFSLAILVESAASVAAKQQAAAPAVSPVQQQQQSPQSGMSNSPLMTPPQQQQQQQQQQVPQPQRPSPPSASVPAAASSVSSSAALKVSPPAPVAFPFNQAKASSEVAATAAAAVSPSLSTQAESQSAVSVDADVSASSPSASPSASPAPQHSLALPTIEPANMPQTPSVEPVITPMPVMPVQQAPVGDAAAVVSGNGSGASLRLPTESTPVVLAGATARFSSTDSTMCWGRADGSSYEVRVGPNYKKYGKKQASRAAMFECVGVDVFGAPDGKLDHVAAHLQLPWIAKRQHASQQSDEADAAAAAADPESLNLATAAPIELPADVPMPPDVMDPINKAWDHYEVDPRVLAQDDELGVPTLFIVNFQIPTYAPGWMSSREDGEGFSILLYFQITAATRSEIRSGRLSGAVQLFKDFVANAHEFEYHSRFKCIPRIVNPGQANVGYAARQAMRMYNSKPFLTGPHCHQFIRGPGYMEADINVHQFCLTARKGAYGFLDALNSLIVDVGFVVEGGRDGNDDELPEQILACSHISHLDPLNAKSLAYYIDAGKKARAKRLAAH